MDRSLLRRIHTLSLRTRRKSATDLLGSYRSTIKGQGLEYEESRGYEPGDDIRHIDWKVTARKGTPHTKRFVEERQMRLLICVDTSDSMRLGGARRSKLQTALQAASIVADAGIREGDTVEILLFDDQVHQHLGPARSEKDFWHIFGQLEKIPQSPYHKHRRGTSFTTLGEAILRLRRRPQVSFLFSDLRGVDLDNTNLRTVQRRTDLYPVQIVSTLEIAPIPLTIRWHDAETGSADQIGAPAQANSGWIRHPLGVLDDNQDLILGLAGYLATCSHYSIQR